MKNHDFVEILNFILNPRKWIGIKLKYYLFEIINPLKVIMIAEKKCPYCGRQFRTFSGIKTHLVRSKCAFTMRQDFMYVESLYEKIRDCLMKYRKKLSGIELLLLCKELHQV